MAVLRIPTTLSFGGAKVRSERGCGGIYVRDIVKLVIMLREPTSFLIAGNCGTGLRNLMYANLQSKRRRESNGR